jgi:hypothetical protein
MPEESGCRDAWAAGLFFINMGIMVYFAFTKGLKAMEETTGAPTPAPAPGDLQQLTEGETKNIIYICVGVIFVAMVLSAIAINFMLSRGESLITCSLWTQIVLKLVCGVIFFAAGLIFPAIFCFILAGLVFCWMRCIKDRIRFAAANLKVACTAVNKHRSVIPVSYLMMILQFGWIVLMILAVTGIQADAAAKAAKENQLTPEAQAQCSIMFDTKNLCDSSCSAHGQSCTAEENNNNQATGKYKCSCGNGISGLSGFLILVSFYWGGLVVKNALNVVVSGSVASWWFNNNNSNVVSGSVKRAFTTSFGSICLGSLLVAVLRALEQMAREARRRGDSAACVAECILSCLTDLLEYFNKWAFVYVGIYGYGFANAGKKVFSLFKDRGWTAIINDDLIENVLSLASVVVGLLCAAVGCAVIGFKIVAFDSGVMTQAYIIVGLLSFFIGMFMSMVVMTIIDTAVAAIFVCFAEDREALSRHQPQLYADFVGAWNEFHPDEMSNCGYAVR